MPPTACEAKKATAVANTTLCSAPFQEIDMNDVFRAHKKTVTKKSMAQTTQNRELDLTPRAEKSGWSCFQCCISADDDDENGKLGTLEHE